MTDPDGRCPQCPAAIGVGLIGGTVAASATAFYDYKTTGSVNVQDLGAAFLGGVVSSGLPVLTLGASLIPEAELNGVLIIGATSNVAGGMITRGLDSQPDDSALSFGGVVQDAVTGGGGAAIGNSAGLLIQRDIAPLRPSLRSFGTKAFSAANRAARNQAAGLKAFSSAAATGIGIAISNAFATVYSALLAPPRPSPPPPPDILPSWRSFLTFGCGCVPYVTSTIHF